MIMPRHATYGILVPGEERAWSPQNRMIEVQEEARIHWLGPSGYRKRHCGLCVPGLKRTDDGTSLNI
jgi:hypothetical protein